MDAQTDTDLNDLRSSQSDNIPAQQQKSWKYIHKSVLYQSDECTNTYRSIACIEGQLDTSDATMHIQMKHLITWSTKLVYPSHPKFPTLFTPHTEWVVPNDKLIPIN